MAGQLAGLAAALTYLAEAPDREAKRRAEEQTLRLREDEAKRAAAEFALRQRQSDLQRDTAAREADAQLFDQSERLVNRLSGEPVEQGFVSGLHPKFQGSAVVPRTTLPARPLGDTPPAAVPSGSVPTGPGLYTVKPSADASARLKEAQAQAAQEKLSFLMQFVGGGIPEDNPAARAAAQAAGLSANSIYGAPRRRPPTPEESAAEAQAAAERAAAVAATKPPKAPTAPKAADPAKTQADELKAVEAEVEREWSRRTAARRPIEAKLLEPYLPNRAAMNYQKQLAAIPVDEAAREAYVQQVLQRRQALRQTMGAPVPSHGPAAPSGGAQSGLFAPVGSAGIPLPVKR